MLPVILLIFPLLCVMTFRHERSKLGLRHVFRQFPSSSPNSQINLEGTPIRKCLEMAMDTQARRGHLLHSSTRFQHIRILFQSHRTHQSQAARSLRATCASPQSSNGHQSVPSLTNKPRVHTSQVVPLSLELTLRVHTGFSSLP